MYEDNEQSAIRRLLVIALVFIAVVAVAWTTVWVLFFRDKQVNNARLQQPRTHTSSGPSRQQSNSTGSNDTPSSSNNNTQTPNGGSSGDTAQNPNSSQSGNLTNVGAGDVFVPFVVATMAGSTLYYVRLRKKLAR